MTADNTKQLPAPVARALANYASEPPAIISSLCRLLMAGNLAGTGRVCILPVDQGNEHGPTRSFKANPPAFDPFYLYRLAVAAGFSAYAAPLGSLRVGAVEFPHVLKIAKLNASCPVRPGGDAAAVSGTVSQALAVEEAARLGCIGVGYTVYFGSAGQAQMLQEAGEGLALARKLGMFGVIWAYPRGAALEKDADQAFDVTDTVVGQSCLHLGAHIVKIKPPTEKLALPEAQKAFADIPRQTLEQRARHIVTRSALGGRRLVVFSGMAKETDELVVQTAGELARGGAAGMIMGRNSFQRPMEQAVELVRQVQAAFRQAAGQG